MNRNRTSENRHLEIVVVVVDRDGGSGGGGSVVDVAPSVCNNLC